ncbi:MAG: damage-inducible protein CinA [Gammaproteobacteria bacterium RIFCSPHIGHO2_12_FULL_41_20]|nr:MAG: damage-inducible protein CinA [Gammaproteobacteria bacterium RIFCSPHIGHO2_12_FULL_41_20]
MHALSLLASQLGNTLKKHQWQIVTAESCTGGGLAYWLTTTPGSSAWFDRGFVTYSNAAKIEQLAVDIQIIEKYGAISAETAREMAEGALTHSHAQLSCAITGIAGPDGGTAQKPVGTVWFAWAGTSLPTQTCLKVFTGDRTAIRHQAIAFALEYSASLIF